MVKVGTVHPRTDHEGPQGEHRLGVTFLLTWAVEEVGGQHPAPAALPPGMTR